MLRRLGPYLDGPGPRLLIGAPDDDAAVWRSQPGLSVATVDTLVEAIDFRLQWRGFDFRTLGRRLMTINLSDLAAMGAEPRHALISLCLRPALPVAGVVALYQGIRDQARRYRFTVAGGDLSSIDGPLALSATIFGEIRRGRPLTRRGARPGWKIGVTGRLGAAALGLELLESGRATSSPAARRWMRAQLDPQPRVQAGRILRDAGITVAGDISDGLYRELARMAEPEGLGATVDGLAIPVDPALRRNRRAWSMIRTSEDFELVCAGPHDRIRAAADRLKKDVRLPLTIVGEFTRQSGLRIRIDGKVRDVNSAGYEHFR